MKLKTRFAGYPSAVAYREPGSHAAGNAVQHLLWGDWFGATGKTHGPWCEGKVRGADRKKGEKRETVWVHERELQDERLLEVNFVDIGQGDGCLIVTPEDRKLVIDAGKKDNMARFLRWRFGRFQKDVRFDEFIITHPDNDHYSGFRHLLRHQRVHVDVLHHNGLVERHSARKLGKELPATDDRPTLVADLVRTRDDLERVLAEEAQQGDLLPYTRLLREALDGGRVGDVRMLSAEDRFLPGYDASRELRIEVLGPVPEDGGLRRLGSHGETKNGHSIVLRLVYRHLSILLGGDLNIPAEHYLLSHYSGLDSTKLATADRELMLERTRKVFGSDVAKACHHGSADFIAEFLSAVNPVATVISSGDGNSYAHPRPDALGSFGRHGRGQRPLIFSTELARSSSEAIQRPNELRRKIAELRRIAREDPDAEARAAAEEKLDDLLNKTIRRSVEVYGMITLRSDGERVVIAQRLDKHRSKKSRWDIYRLEPNLAGRLVYQSQHEYPEPLRSLSLRVLEAARRCPTKGWYERRLPREAEDADRRTRNAQRAEVVELARRLYPTSVVADPEDMVQAAAQTLRYVDDPGLTTIWNPTFQSGESGASWARADLLVRSGDGDLPKSWDLVRIQLGKSPDGDGTVEPKYIRSLAFATMVARSAVGDPTTIGRAKLLLLSRSYRQGDPVEELFVEHDVTAEVEELIRNGGRGYPPLETFWEQVRRQTARRKPPKPVLNRECRRCRYFGDHCLGRNVEHRVTDLPKYQKLLPLDDAHLPSDEALPPEHHPYAAAVRSGEAMVGEDLRPLLDQVQWPVYYLDFETTSAALPLFKHQEPWDQALTQYSIHVYDAPGTERGHLEYLAPFSDTDPEKALLPRLLQDLGTEGSILVYYEPFERGRLEALAERFPNARPDLEKLIARLFDLKDAFHRDLYWHPDFDNFTSIKVVLPVVCPGDGYEHLAIQDGATASSVFADAVRGRIAGNRLETIRNDLLAYCRQDTRSMVDLHHRLMEPTNS